MLDPEAFPVAADGDVVRRQRKAAEAIGESRERRDQAKFGEVCGPDADFSVLMSGEEADGVRGDNGGGLDGAGGGEGGEGEDLTEVR